MVVPFPHSREAFALEESESAAAKAKASSPYPIVKRCRKRSQLLGMQTVGFCLNSRSSNHVGGERVGRGFSNFSGNIPYLSCNYIDYD